MVGATFALATRARIMINKRAWTTAGVAVRFTRAAVFTIVRNVNIFQLLNVTLAVFENGVSFFYGGYRLFERVHLFEEGGLEIFVFVMYFSTSAFQFFHKFSGNIHSFGYFL